MRARSAIALSALALSVALLSGCSPTAEPAMLEAAAPVDLCARAAPEGAVSQALVVTGDVGAPASLALTAPVTVTAVERTVLVEGTGDPLQGSALVDYAVTVFDASTGQALLTQGYDGVEQLPTPAVSLAQYLGCAPIGSRIVVAAPATDVDPATVQVFDVLGTRPGVATGSDQDRVNGMPEVELSEGGTPSVRIPGAEPPAETEVAVLKKGDGDTVQPGDTVMMQYSGVRWSNGLNFESSWNAGVPATLVTTEVIEGYRPALEGQTVGSQVLVVIPPAAAYGEGEINEDDLTGETLVMVVDILATAPTPAA